MLDTTHTINYIQGRGFPGFKPGMSMLDRRCRLLTS